MKTSSGVTAYRQIVWMAVDLFSKDVFQTDNVRLPRRSFQSLGNSLRFRSKEKWQISYRIG